MRVRVISESQFSVKGHGVHTAFVEHVNALKSRADVEVLTNAFGRCDITHFHTVGLYSLLHLVGNKSKKVISAHVVPASLVGSLVGAKVWLPLASAYLRWFYNRADVVLAVSDETKRELEQLGVKRPITVVYNTIDTSKYATTAADRITARETLSIPAEAWVVVGAGQVQPRKRVDDFVKVARELPDVRFIWVGGMPFGKLAAENSAMNKLVKSAPQNVTFTGVVEHELVKQYYRAANVFWLPSEQETFGLVVVEAAATGLPVLLRSIDDYRETFAPHALMVSVDKTAGMIDMLRNDQSFYVQAAAHAAEIARQFDSETGAETLIAVYRRLLS